MKTKYQMMWGGQWCSVTNMYDARNTPTTLPLRCVKAVLFARKGVWVAIEVNPGDIVARPEHRTKDWDMVY